MKVFIQFGSGLGSMSRVFPIAQGLQNMGWEIKYSGYPSARKYMEQLQIEELDEDFCFNDKTILKPYAEWESAEEFWEMMGYNDFEWIWKKTKQLIKAIESFAPDLVICDLGILAWLAAKIKNIPLVAITQSCYHPERKYDNFRWWESKTDKLMVKHYLKEWINKILNSYGIEPILVFEEIFVGDLTIIPSYEEIDWLKGTNKYNTIYSGPILYDEKVSVSEEIISAFTQKNKKVIFSYTGRFYDNVGESGFLIFKSLLNTYADDLGVNVVVAVGGEDEVRMAREYIEKYHVPCNNIFLVEFLPMNFAFQNADIVVHHGGHGSCLGQVEYGVPSVIIPTHSEREYNARVFEKLGFSEVVSPKKLLHDVKNAINKIIRDDNYRKRLLAFKEQKENMKNYGLDLILERIVLLSDKSHR